MTFNRRHRPQRVEVNADHRENRVDGRDTNPTACDRSKRGLADVRDVRRHLGPDRYLRDVSHPARHFLRAIRMWFGYSFLTWRNSSSQTSIGRSEINSMFSKPITSPVRRERSLP